MPVTIADAGKNKTKQNTESDARNEDQFLGDPPLHTCNSHSTCHLARNTQEDTATMSFLSLFNTRVDAVVVHTNEMYSVWAKEKRKFFHGGAMAGLSV